MPIDANEVTWSVNLSRLASKALVAKNEFQCSLRFRRVESPEKSTHSGLIPQRCVWLVSIVQTDFVVDGAHVLHRKAAAIAFTNNCDPVKFGGRILNIDSYVLLEWIWNIDRGYSSLVSEWSSPLAL